MRLVIEACCYAALAWVCLSRPAVRASAAALPAPHRWLLGAFFLLLTGAQLLDRPRVTFPLTSWAMYGKPEHPDTLVFYRYHGLAARRQPVVIPAERLLAVVGASGVASKTKGLARAGLSPSASDAQRARLADWTRAIGRLYNRRHSDHPVDAVELIRYTLPLGGGDSMATEERVLRVALDAGERS